jgi:hypothetical protein
MATNVSHKNNVPKGRTALHSTKCGVGILSYFQKKSNAKLLLMPEAEGEQEKKFKNQSAKCKIVDMPEAYKK